MRVNDISVPQLGHGELTIASEFGLVCSTRMFIPPLIWLRVRLDERNAYPVPLAPGNSAPPCGLVCFQKERKGISNIDLAFYHQTSAGVG